MSAQSESQLASEQNLDADPGAGVERSGAGKLLRLPLVRFAAVGIINNAIGYGVFVLLSILGLSAIGAMTVSYTIGMGISFFGNRRWTFDHRGPVGSSLVRFLAVNAVGYGLNFALLSVLVSGLRFPQIPAQLFALAVVAVVSFFLMRLWAFRNTSTDTQGGAKK